MEDSVREADVEIEMGLRSFNIDTKTSHPFHGLRIVHSVSQQQTAGLL